MGQRLFFLIIFIVALIGLQSYELTSSLESLRKASEEIQDDNLWGTHIQPNFAKFWQDYLIDHHLTLIDKHKFGESFDSIALESQTNLKTSLINRLEATQKIKETYDLQWNVVKAVLIGVVGYYSFPIFLSTIGLTTEGVAAGSAAAAAQSTFYGGSTGGIFSFFQSCGALGGNSVIQTALAGISSGSTLAVSQEGDNPNSTQTLAEELYAKSQDESLRIGVRELHKQHLEIMAYYYALDGLLYEINKNSFDLDKLVDFTIEKIKSLENNQLLKQLGLDELTSVSKEELVEYKHHFIKKCGIISESLLSKVSQAGGSVADAAAELHGTIVENLPSKETVMSKTTQAWGSVADAAAELHGTIVENLPSKETVKSKTTQAWGPVADAAAELHGTIVENLPSKETAMSKISQAGGHFADAAAKLHGTVVESMSKTVKAGGSVENSAADTDS